MFGSVILDVAIGLILVFLLLSLVTSSVQETLAGARHRRPKTLLRGIRELLRDESLVDAFYQHPRIAALYRGRYEDAKKSGKLPSYIPADAFSSALLDMAARGRNPNVTLQGGSEANLLTLQTVRQHINNLGDLQVQRLVLAAVDTAQGDLAKAHASIEAWFNGSMDRVSGWYKRDTQLFLFLIGLVATVLLDVDALHIARELYRDPARREAAIAMASAVTQQSRQATPGTPADSVARAAALGRVAKDAMDSLRTLGIPIGWKDNGLDGLPSNAAEWKAAGTHAGESWFGWLFTAIAVSFGAPFWFDMLNKVMVIRSTVKPREKSREEGSEDRQSKDRAGGSATVGAPPAQVIVVTPGGAAAGSLSSLTSAGGVDFKPHEWASGHSQGGVL